MGAVVGCDAREQAGLYEHHNVYKLLCSLLDEEENQLVPYLLLFLHAKQQSDEMHIPKLFLVKGVVGCNP